MSGGCLLSLILAMGPRLAFLFIWLFTPRVDLAFDSVIIPLLGFIFLPFTVFAYVLVWSPAEGVSGLGWVVVIIALIIDISLLAGGIYSNRHRLGAEEEPEGESS